jgi:predicted RND superfamily exporter protein
MSVAGSNVFSENNERTGRSGYSFGTNPDVTDKAPIESSTGFSSETLLNANRAKLSAMTSPHNFYFLEFPVPSGSNRNYGSPICGDGSPFSFAFRRGSDQHRNKLVVEFEGGPACFNGGCCEEGARRTPWKNLTTFNNLSDYPFPPLDSCPGVASGFAKELSSLLLGNDDSDIPITLRENNTDSRRYWWEALGSDGSDIRDWSYIFIPHCTMDWHLGHALDPRQTGCAPGEFTFHRGGTNMEAVMNWVATQFSSTGLDALVTTSGGRIGGCDPSSPDNASSIAPALFASALANVLPAKPSTMLVLIEGASLWNNDLPSNDMMLHQWSATALGNSGLVGTTSQIVSNSPDTIQYVWFSSEGGGLSSEREWLANMKTTRPENFHIYSPSAGEVTDGWCPNFAFPDSGDAEQENKLSAFIQNIRNRMAWESNASDGIEESERDNVHLSFLSIALILLGFVALAWVVYYSVRHYRHRHGLPPPSSPSEMWMKALTYYPLVFLTLSVFIPVALSFVAIARSGYKIKINLNFNTYLAIDSDLDRVAANYGIAQQYQEESFLQGVENCQILNGTNSRRLYDQDARHLQSSPGEEFTYATGGQLISIIYQNRHGGNVFTPEILQQIYGFEQSIVQFPGFSEYCVFLGGQCLPFDSLAARFFDFGRLKDIDSVLRTFVRSKQDVWKVDQYFGPNHLESNITRTFIWLKNVGGDQSAANPFLEELYRDLFWELQEYYPDMVFTWENKYLQELEAQDALNHDILWSVGSLCFIGLMILFKVHDFFVFFFAILGLLLAFTTSYYWCLVHFDIQEITLLHVSGLFVMLGIGADDIFLMVDSFEHAKVKLGSEHSSESNDSSEMIRRRMRWAYSTAGSMMLVSSMTTAVCFFSNAFGVLLVIQEFGIYMGVVVLINFLHVMTILPSAILVNEVYIRPWKQRLSKDEGRQDLPIHQMEPDSDHEGLNRMDSWLLGRYAPFATKRRGIIFLGSIVFAAIMAYLGVANFEPSDGSIVLFSEKYNQGRLTALHDAYFNDNLSKSIEDLVSIQLSPTGGGGGSENGGSEGNEGSGSGSGNGGAGSGNGSTGGSGGGGSSGTGGGNGQPTNSPLATPTLPPSGTLNNGDSGNNLSPITGPQETDIDNLQRKEMIIVKLIWGVEAATESNPWLIEEKSQNKTDTFSLLKGIDPNFALSEPATQQWLYDVVQFARRDKALNVQGNSLTWIEILHGFATMSGVGFPAPRDFFIGYVEMLRTQNAVFDSLVRNEIGTYAPGLAGQVFYTSITLQADVVQTAGSLSLNTYKTWSSFTSMVNELAPPGMTPVIAQSDIFWNGYRTEETVNSTVVTWLIANGLCFAIILLFTQNLLLCLMVMASITLIFLCIVGWLFAVFGLVFGPVQALGVSIFIGLSANYSLHVVHAYHRASGSLRTEKVRQALFITGSPICASALSTIGGSAFLFGCRTSALVELGILICCITAMALLYSMGYLLTWLLIIGPLPYENVKEHGNGHKLHRWDLAACSRCFQQGDARDNGDKDGAAPEHADYQIADPEKAENGADKSQAVTMGEFKEQATFVSEENSSSGRSGRNEIPSETCNGNNTNVEAQDENTLENNENLEKLRRRKDAIELWHKEKKEGSDRSLMSYLSC